MLPTVGRETVPFRHRRSILIFSAIIIVASIQLLSSSGILRTLDDHHDLLTPPLPSAPLHRKFNRQETYSASSRSSLAATRAGDASDTYGQHVRTTATTRPAPGLSTDIGNGPDTKHGDYKFVTKTLDEESTGSHTPITAAAPQNKSTNSPTNIGVYALPPAPTNPPPAPAHVDARTKPNVHPLFESHPRHGKGSHYKLPFLSEFTHSFRAQKAQPALNTFEYIVHQRTSWTPNIHNASTYTDMACSCPDDTPSELQSLKNLSAKLPQPKRIQATSKPAPIKDIFSDVYVVNVPSRDDRSHYMCALLKHLQIPALMWPAYTRSNPLIRQYSVTQRSADYNPKLDYWFQGPTGNPIRPRMRSSEISCWASHREVWLNIVDRQLGPTLVLEDDLDMEEEFVEVMANAMRAIPKDWSILWVGHCYEDLDSPHNATTKVGHRLYHALRPACTHAYAINGHQVASALMDEIGHDLAMPVDIAMAHLTKNETSGLSAYVMLPPPVAQLPRTTGSKRGPGSTNPSNVSPMGLALPLQPLVLPARAELWRQEEIALKEKQASADGLANSSSGSTQPLCGNVLFTAPQPNSTTILVEYPPEDFTSRGQDRDSSAE